MKATYNSFKIAFNSLLISVIIYMYIGITIITSVLPETNTFLLCIMVLNFIILMISIVYFIFSTKKIKETEECAINSRASYCLLLYKIMKYEVKINQLEKENRELNYVSLQNRILNEQHLESEHHL